MKSSNITIVVRPNESDDGGICNRAERITSRSHEFVCKNAIERVMIQSIEGKCLTLSFAIQFGASRARNDLQKYFHERLVLKCFEDRPRSVQVMCKVTTACEDERHAIHGALHRMIRRLSSAPETTASQGEAGQQRLLATSTLVLDNVPAEADPPAPLSAGGAVRHDPAAAKFLGGAPPPASTAAPHVAGRAVAAGAPRADPSLQAWAAGPSGPRLPGPRAASATAASCDSEVGPLCGMDSSRCIRVVIKMDAGGSSIFGNTNPYPHADLYLASGVVDATSRFFGEHQMDHILSTTASDPLRGMVELVTVRRHCPGPGRQAGDCTGPASGDCRRISWGPVEGGRRHPCHPGGVEHRSGVSDSSSRPGGQALKVRDDAAFHLIVEGGVAATNTRAVLNCRAPASASSHHHGSASAEKRRRSDSPTRRWASSSSAKYTRISVCIHTS
jgi:hypothetical protein